MVLTTCLGVWRIFLCLFLLCAYRQSIPARADASFGSKPTQKSGRQPSMDDQHHQTDDDAVNTQGNANRNPNSHRDKTVTKENRASGKLSKDGPTADDAPASSTNQKQTVEEAYDNQQPISDDQLGKLKTQSADTQRSSSDSVVQETTPNENDAQHDAGIARGRGAEISKEEGGAEDPTMRKDGGRSLIDEPTAGRDAVLEAPLEAPGTIHSNYTMDAKTPSVSTEQQSDSNEEHLRLEDSNELQDDMHVEPIPAMSDSQDGKDAEIDNINTAKETSTPLVLDLEMAEDVVEVDTRTQQINQEASSININKAPPSLTIESQDAESSQPSKIVEEDHRDSSELPQQEDLSSNDVSSEKDPIAKPVEHASGEGDEASKDSLAADATPKGTTKEESEDASSAELKDVDKEDIIPVDKDETKMVSKEEKDEKVKEKQEEGKKPDATEKDEEEMPSFDEWKQKMLEQHEQERQHGQAGQGSAALPLRPFSLTENSKNHASSDCGAKILNVNKETQNAPAILQSNRDVYTLNPCTANIWFTVELCEPIQVKHLEIANYELFSSVPKSFRVSISDRFPTREWRQIGTFHAREERSLQSFPVLEEQMFAKYMKIEMLTFFGSEHYCPLSTLRVFGTSMVEEIDEENIAEDGLRGESEVLPAHPTPVPEDNDKGLLHSAKGLVRNLMNVITGNHIVNDATPCENKNESCTEAEEMLPCMPEDEPKALQAERSNLSATEQQGSRQCQAQNMSDFSLDPAQFQRECRGSTWCFSPNYGQQFQDCCVREVAASSYATQSFLCCKDAVRLSLYRSMQTLQPSIVKKDALQSCKDDNCASQGKGRKTVVDQIEINVEEKTVPKTNEKKDGGGKERIQSDGISQGEGLTASSSGAQSSISSSSETLQRHSESQVKPTTVLPAREVATADFQLPTPTPSLKSTCSTVPIEQPPVVLVPPISILPTDAQEEKELQVQTGGAQVSAVDEDTPVIELDKPALEKPSHTDDSLSTSDKDDIAKVKDQSAEAGNEPQEVTARELKAPVSQTGLAAKGSGSSAGAEKPDLAAAPDSSSKADATEKEPGKIEAMEEATKSMKAHTEETRETPKVEPGVKIPETIKTETAGKGTKAVPETGSNGAGAISSIAQKESVFMRLNNRIKSLELNMSLSSRYLEELSQRYRKQMDEMQKAFNKTIKTLTENAQKAEEKDQKQKEYITRLEGQMSEVIINIESTSQRLDSLHKEVIERHLFLMVIEILLMSILFLICIRRLRRGHYISDHGPPVVIRSHGNSIRRNSLPITPAKNGQNNNALPRTSKRTISGGSCDDLLIVGPSTPFLESLKQASESTRHKPKNRAKYKPPAKSISNSALQYNHQSSIPQKQASKMTIAGVLFRGPAFSGGQAPPDSPTDPIYRTVSAEDLPCRVQDVKGGAPPIRQQHLKAGVKNVAKRHGVMLNGRR